MKMTMKMKKGLSVLAVTAVVLVLTATLFVGAGAAVDGTLGPWTVDRTALQGWSISGDTITMTVAESPDCGFYAWHGNSSQVTNVNYSKSWKVESTVSGTDLLTNAITSLWVQVDGIKDDGSIANYAKQDHCVAWAIAGYNKSTGKWQWFETHAGGWVDVTQDIPKSEKYTVAISCDDGVLTYSINGIVINSNYPAFDTPSGCAGNLTAPAGVFLECRAYGSVYSLNWTIPKVSFELGYPYTSTVGVKDESGLTAAIENPAVTDIVLANDITLNKKFEIKKPVTIDGQYHTIGGSISNDHLVAILNVNGGAVVSLINVTLDSKNQAKGLNIHNDTTIANQPASWTAYLTNVVLMNSAGSGLTLKSNAVVTNLTTCGNAWQSIDVGPSNTAGGGAARVLTIDTLTQLNDLCAIISDEVKSSSYTSIPATVSVVDGNVIKDELADRYYWTVPVVQIGETKYATLEKAVAAAKTGDTITLLKNIAATTQIEIADKEIVLDLNGNEISYVNSTTLKSGVLLVHNGAGLTINDTIGSGAIDSGTKAYAAIALTKKGDDPSVAAKLTVNDGTLRGYYYAITGNGNRDNTEITINGGIILGTCDDDSTAIFHPQNGTLTINGGLLSGATGMYIKSGDLAFTKFNGGIITGIGSKQPYVTTDDGFVSTGDALTIDTCGYPGGDPSVSIAGGKFTSANATAVGSYAKVGKTALMQFITGGQFSDTSVCNYTAPGYCAILNDVSGYYEVVAGSEPTIDVKPVQNGTATDISITPSGNTDVIVIDSTKSVVLQDNITNVAVVYTFDEMTKTADKVTGKVAEINAVYPEMNASENVQGTVTTPVKLILVLNKTLVGDVVLPKINTEYNVTAASKVSNPIATITGLPNGDQTLDQINSNITEVNMTFKNIPAPGSGHRYVAYHVTDSEIEAVKYWNENVGGDLQFTSTKGFSSYVLASETVNHYVPSSSSKQSGYSQILSEGQVAPTAVPTVAPTAAPTEKPATPVINPSAKPTTEPTQKSPAPVVGLIAGLGAAALFLRLRK